MGAQEAPATKPERTFEGVRLNGSPFESSELDGGIVLLDFWGSWCPPCIKAFPKLSRLHDDYAERGFQVVGLAVKSGTAEEVAAFLESHGVTYPIVLVDTQVPDLFGVQAYPTYFLLGESGQILEAFHGIPTDLYEHYSALLEPLLPAASEGR